EKQPRDRPGGTPSPRRTPSALLMVLLAVSLGLLAAQFFVPQPQEISYSFFDEQVRKGNVRRIEVRGQTILGEFKVPPYESELRESKADSKTTQINAKKPNAEEGEPSPAATEVPASEPPTSVVDSEEPEAEEPTEESPEGE